MQQTKSLYTNYRILITSSHNRIGYSVVSSLLASGYPVVASGLVSPSMCCNLQGLIGEYLYEDPYYDSKLFCLRLIEIASKEKCSHLLPVHEEVFPILEHIDLFIKAGIEVISPTLEEIL